MLPSLCGLGKLWYGSSGQGRPTYRAILPWAAHGNKEVVLVASSLSQLRHPKREAQPPCVFTSRECPTRAFSYLIIISQIFKVTLPAINRRDDIRVFVASPVHADPIYLHSTVESPSGETRLQDVRSTTSSRTHFWETFKREAGDVAEHHRINSGPWALTQPVSRLLQSALTRQVPMNPDTRFEGVSKM